MKTLSLNSMEYKNKFMEMLSNEASNYDSFMGDSDDSFEDENGYEDEYAGGAPGAPSAGRLSDADRIITFNVANLSTVVQTAILFGANVYDLNNTTLFPATVSITVDQSSHYQMRQSSIANPMVFDYWRMILNDTTPAQFSNSLTYGENTNGGVNKSAQINPNTYSSAFQFQGNYREGKYRFKIGGDNFIIISLNPSTSFSLILQKGMELNVDQALIGRPVVESNKKMLGTLPTQKLVVSKR